MTKYKDELNSFCAELMIEHGPDRHCDGHEIIAKKLNEYVLKNDPVVKGLADFVLKSSCKLPGNGAYKGGHEVVHSCDRCRALAPFEKSVGK